MLLKAVEASRALFGGSGGVGDPLPNVLASALVYARRGKVRRIDTRPRFRRELVVVVSRELPARGSFRQFVECILF